MPTRLAARKCPSSCTNTSTPSTNGNERIVINRRTSDLQFYPSRQLERTLARPLIDCTDLLERCHLDRRMHIHCSLDDLRNRREADPSLEKTRDRDFVGRVQHHGQAALRLERAIREAQAWKCVDVGRGELEPSGVSEIQRGKRSSPPRGVREPELNRQP